MPSFSSWRGTVGLVKPTMRPGNLEDLIRMLPPGIGVIPLFNNIREGTRSEFAAVIAGYEAKTAELAEAGIDLVHPQGAPPFMVLGHDDERELIRGWEKKYRVSVFTSGMVHTAALQALKMKRFIGVSYFRDPGLNETYGKYFTDAGFDIITMRGMDVDFDKVQELSSLQVYSFIRRLVIEHPDTDGIYMLGPAWNTLDIVDMLEADFGIPVVHATPALCWQIQKRLHVRQPVRGFGRLLFEMP
jgi:maleate isomerase